MLESTNEYNFWLFLLKYYIWPKVNPGTKTSVSTPSCVCLNLELRWFICSEDLFL